MIQLMLQYDDDNMIIYFKVTKNFKCFQKYVDCGDDGNISNLPILTDANLSNSSACHCFTVMDLLNCPSCSCKMYTEHQVIGVSATTINNLRWQAI